MAIMTGDPVVKLEREDNAKLRAEILALRDGLEKLSAFALSRGLDEMVDAIQDVIDGSIGRGALG